VSRTALLTVCALLATACADAGRHCAADRVELSVLDEQGVRPATFQVTFGWGEDGLAARTCTLPDDSDPQVECTATGASLKVAPSSVHVAIKAHGARTTTIEQLLRYRRAPNQDGRCDGDVRRAELELTLPTLPPLTINADYATGFSAETGLADFTRMAVASPTEAGDVLVVKFFIQDVQDDPQVYFQNTSRHALHYQFFRSVLGGALSMQDYEATTYFGEDRTNMAGSVILYSDRSVPSAAFAGELSSPLTLEFFPSDNLSPRLALLAHRLLEERVLFAPLEGALHRVAYVPATVKREEELEGDRRAFARFSALWLERAELYGHVAVQYLNEGKACGTLRRMTPEQLALTPLSYRDVVVLTRLPNELPLVGGTITEELQTPLAHVNVAARARGTPNMALLDAANNPRIAPLFDHLICLEVMRSSFSLVEVTLVEAETFWATLVPPTPFIPDSDLTATGLLDFASIGFTDAVRVGVKAANIAELTHVLGDIAPEGFAVPFYYYDQFMRTSRVSATLCSEAQTDCLLGGRLAAACQAVSDACIVAANDTLTLDAYLERSSDDDAFEIDTLLREASLNTLRYLINHSPVEATFAAALDAKVSALVGAAKVRMRSSTNAEDLEQFSGAGLYDSYSAQIGTDRAPSSRVRKVWASVFSWPAFEERGFWNIDQRATKMGVAVHRSFPDEVANGVLITQSIANPAVNGYYVNIQLGEVSVTNPEGGVLPEILTIVPLADGITVLRDRYSTLSPGQPIMTDAEIRALYQAATAVLQHFSVLYGENPYTFALEMELKLIPPDRRLLIKQVRPYYQR
jgi:hypothetical protein